MRRVAITGAGTVNALAADLPGTLAAMTAGRSAIGPLQIADLDRLSIKIGAQVRDWRPEAHLSRDELVFLDRHSQFAVVAAREAVVQSGLTFDAPLALRTAVIMGTAGGGLITQDDAFRAVYAEGKTRVHPFTVPRLMHSAAASQISMAHGLRGPAFSVSSACASSNHAMGLAFQMVRSGAAPVVLTGGSEAMLSFGGLKAWEGLRVMSPDACRPFSMGRNGMVQGEGAAVLVFEDWNLALRRGAKILAEVIGFAMTSDASDIVAPSVEGAARTIALALQDAGVSAGDVDYVNAHGTGTALNDRCETAALHAVFGAAVSRLPVSSTKAMHGHLIGATGAVELLACLLALKDGILAPTVGFLGADPDCELDVVPNLVRKAEVRVAMSNAFAFGGLNAVLVLRKA